VTLVEFLEGAGIGGATSLLIREVAGYVRALATKKSREEEPAESPAAPRKEVGGLAWFWKELHREKGAWRAVEAEVHALEGRVRYLEGREDGAPQSRRKGA
jgi:hypothetical protein